MGAVEIEPANVADPRVDHDVGRIAGEPRPRDAVLHDVEGIDHYARDAGTPRAAGELAFERALGAEDAAESVSFGHRIWWRRRLRAFPGHDHAAAENVGA